MLNLFNNALGFESMLEAEGISGHEFIQLQENATLPKGFREGYTT